MSPDLLHVVLNIDYGFYRLFINILFFSKFEAHVQWKLPDCGFLKFALVFYSRWVFAVLTHLTFDFYLLTMDPSKKREVSIFQISVLSLFFFFRIVNNENRFVFLSFANLFSSFFQASDDPPSSHPTSKRRQPPTRSTQPMEVRFRDNLVFLALGRSGAFFVGNMGKENLSWSVTKYKIQVDCFHFFQNYLVGRWGHWSRGFGVADVNSREEEWNRKFYLFKICFCFYSSLFHGFIWFWFTLYFSEHDDLVAHPETERKPKESVALDSCRDSTPIRFGMFVDHV